MDRFKVRETIEDNELSTIFKATLIQTGEAVTIKKIKKKYYSWDECMGLRELKSLRKLLHPNIIKLKEAINCTEGLYLVFDNFDQTLYSYYTNESDCGRQLADNKIRSIIYQVASGLAHMHKHGYFHRNLKPSNILISGDVVKISGFDLAKETYSRSPHTDYITERWYRAPEVLLGSKSYNGSIDIFALGCIMAELYSQTPLFKGSSDMDQLFKICSILGTPTRHTWSEGFILASQMGVSFPQFTTLPLSIHIDEASEEALNLISEMLKYDPQRRISAQNILQHPYFADHIPIDYGFHFNKCEKKTVKFPLQSKLEHSLAHLDFSQGCNNTPTRQIYDNPYGRNLSPVKIQNRISLTPKRPSIKLHFNSCIKTRDSLLDTNLSTETSNRKKLDILTDSDCVTRTSAFPNQSPFTEVSISLEKSATPVIANSIAWSMNQSPKKVQIPVIGSGKFDSKRTRNLLTNPYHLPKLRETENKKSDRSIHNSSSPALRLSDISRSKDQANLFKLNLEKIPKFLNISQLSPISSKEETKKKIFLPITSKKIPKLQLNRGEGLKTKLSVKDCGNQFFGEFCDRRNRILDQLNV